MDNHNPLVTLTVLAPAHNEAGNIEALVREVGEAAVQAAAAWEDQGEQPPSFEFLLVDDASTDTTAAEIQAEMAKHPWVRLVQLKTPAAGGGNGQSAAFGVGFAHARGKLIALLDADLQNDPAELPAMIKLMREQDADMVQGDRSRNRKDNWVKRRGSEVGRFFRRVILGDTVRDTGCSLRVFKKEVAEVLPMAFKGMHRFIPATAAQAGFKVVEMDVVHRAREVGETKYGKLGITKRALPGLIDCFAVRWMGNRRRLAQATELQRAEAVRTEEHQTTTQTSAQTPAQPEANS